MAAFVGRLNAITRETGAAVPVVRHPGKDDARGHAWQHSAFCSL